MSRQVVNPITAFLNPITKSDPIRSLFGFDLDERYLFHSEKTGYPVITFLLSFEVGLVTLLGITSQGKGQHVSLLIAMFIVTSLLVIAGIVGTVRARVRSDSNGTKVVRAYDEGTIRFARWGLFTSIFLAATFTSLALIGAIPGQTPRRKPFEQAEIFCTTDFAYRKIPKNLSSSDSEYRKDVLRMNMWFSHINDGVKFGDPENKERLFWVEQVNGFDSDYEDIRARIKLSEQYSFKQATAFVVSNSNPRRYLPVYRQIRFDADDSEGITPDFVIEAPEEGERLLVLLHVREIGGIRQKHIKAEDVVISVLNNTQESEEQVR